MQRLYDIRSLAIYHVGSITFTTSSYKSCRITGFLGDQANIHIYNQLCKPFSVNSVVSRSVSKYLQAGEMIRFPESIMFPGKYNK